MPVERIKKVIKNNTNTCSSCGKVLKLGLLGILTSNDIKYCPFCGQRNKVQR